MTPDDFIRRWQRPAAGRMGDRKGGTDAAVAREETQARPGGTGATTLSRTLAHLPGAGPACGSGNFLYLALQALKDLEHQVMLATKALGLRRGFPAVGPEAALGIEINPYPAELARLTAWISEQAQRLQSTPQRSRFPPSAISRNEMPRSGSHAPAWEPLPKRRPASRATGAAQPAYPRWSVGTR